MSWIIQQELSKFLYQNPISHSLSLLKSTLKSIEAKIATIRLKVLVDDPTYFRVPPELLTPAFEARLKECQNYTIYIDPLDCIRIDRNNGLGSCSMQKFNLYELGEMVVCDFDYLDVHPDHTTKDAIKYILECCQTHSSKDFTSDKSHEIDDSLEEQLEKIEDFEP